MPHPYDLDYEIYCYIREQADRYIPLEQLLNAQRITMSEAQSSAEQTSAQFKAVCDSYGLPDDHLAALCLHLCTLLRQSPDDPALQWLYFMTLTDTGLLFRGNAPEATPAQNVRNYLIQKEKVQLLTDFVQTWALYADKIKQLRILTGHLNPPAAVSGEEIQQVHKLCVQHTFLYGAKHNQIFRENLENLLMLISSTPELAAIKPWIIFAILSRRHGLMQNRMHYTPNLLIAFQYQIYSIHADNGKNFNLYQSYLELYDHLHRFYMQDKMTDIELCDHCFAAFSPLCEWYYAYCVPDAQIPKNLFLLIQEKKALSFPQLFVYADYSGYDLEAFIDEKPALYRQWAERIDAELTEAFLHALAAQSSVTEILERLPHAQNHQPYAMLLLYEAAENALSARMTKIAGELLPTP